MQFLQDVRQALRLLARNPGFAATACLTVALGVGGTTAVFSVVYGALIRPLPYDEPEQIVAVAEEHPGATSGFGGTALSNLTYLAWRDTATTIESIGAYAASDATLSDAAIAERVSATYVTPSLLDVVRAVPAQGRLLRDDDAAEAAPEVVLVGQRFRSRRFGRDTPVLGRILTLDGEPHEVVGVLPADFAFPGPEPSDIYRVLRVRQPVAGATGDAPMQTLRVLARLSPGVSPVRAAAEATAAARSVDRPLAAMLLFGEGGPVEVRVSRWADHLTASVRPALTVLTTAIGFVLVIACANVANLFLSLGSRRALELTVRTALGATRARLIQQQIVEGLVVSFTGGTLGAGLGWLATILLPALAPADFPRLADIRVDLPFLVVALVVSSAVGIGTALLPALRHSRPALAVTMRGNDRRVTDRRGRRLGSVLLAVEAGLAVMLLIGALLLGRSLVMLTDVDTGYDAEGVLVATLHASGAERQAGRGPAAVRAILDRLRAHPDVAGAGAANMTPFGNLVAISRLRLPGPPGPDGNPPQARALSPTITPGFAEALGLQVRAGRLFGDADGSAAIRPVLVNDAFVRTYLNDGRPSVGRVYNERFGLAGIEIVGVVGDMLQGRLDGSPEPQLYFPLSPEASVGQVTLVIRTRSRTSRLAPALRSIVDEVAPGIAVDGIEPLGDRISRSVSRPRFATTILGSFALLAAGLAATGLYGVLSYQVSRRRRELGVRAALGADRRRLLAMVLGQGLAVTSVGMAGGLLAALAGTRLLASLLFGVSRLDLVSFLAAPAFLIVVALVASLIPAVRASAVDPADALRAE